VIAFFTKATGQDLEPVFSQYLHYARIPELEFSVEQDTLRYRWKADIEDFAMPVDLFIQDREHRIYPTTQWKVLQAEADDIRVAGNRFFIQVSGLR